VVWKWHQTRYNNDQQSVPDDPSRFTIAFNPEGTLSIRADFNRGGGKYSIEGKGLTIELTHSTRAMCPPNSPEHIFISNEVFRNSLILQEEEEATGIADEFLPCHI